MRKYSLYFEMAKLSSKNQKNEEGKVWFLIDSRGRIFSQAGNKLGESSFLAGNEFLNDFPLHLVPCWERASSRTD